MNHLQNLPIYNATDMQTFFNQMFNIYSLIQPIYKSGKIWDWVYLDVNPAWEKKFGIPKEKTCGKSYRELFGDIDDTLQIVEKAEITENVSRIEGYFEIHKKYLVANSFPLGENKIAVIYEDFTEIMEIHKKLYETAITIEKQTRKKLASDIHEEVGPLLTTIQMYISVLNKNLQDKSMKDMAVLLESLILRCNKGLREIINNLTPSSLEDKGLQSSIKEEIDNHSHLLSINFQNNVGDLRFPLIIEINYFRIFKELLNNAIKHSGTDKINVALNFIRGELILSFRDFGIGLDRSLSMKEGNGLKNIKIRSLSINGKYSLRGFPGKGTYFIVKTPAQTTVYN